MHRNKPLTVVLNGSQRPVPSRGPNKNGIGYAIEMITSNISNIDIRSMSLFDKTLENYKYDKVKHIQIKPKIFYKLLFKMIFCLPHSFLKKVYGFTVADRQIYYYSIGLELKRLKPDIVISQTHYYLFAAAKKYFPNAKHIFHFRGSNLTDWRKELIEDLYQRSDGLITVCKFPINDVSKRLGLVHHNSRVIPNAIDKKLFSQDKCKEQIKRFKIKYKLDEKSFVFLYAGRMDKSKGIYQIINAFNRLNKIRDNVILLIVGKNLSKYDDDDLIRYLEKMVSNKKNLNIKLLEAVDINTMPELYKISQVSLMCSLKNEGCSKFILESLSSGLPTIVTKVGGNSEIIQDGINGITISTKNIEVELFNAMQRLFDDKSLFIKLANQSRKSVDGKFDYDNLVKSYEDFILDTWEKV